MSTTTASTQPAIDLAGVDALAEAVSADRNQGKVTFTMLSESTGGLTAKTNTGPVIRAGVADESRRGKFTLYSDEPTTLLGTDTAVSPAEYILQGLAGCYTVTLTALAAAEGITLDSIGLTLGFDIDLAGFLGLDPDVRKGAQQITVDVDLQSAGTPREKLEELVSGLAAASAIHDTLANAVPVNARLA